jgi:hypothetical protein
VLYQGIEGTMKEKEIIKVLSKDGEIHFVLRDHAAQEEPKECVCLKGAEMVTVLKREAAKPLLLLRAE